MKILIFSRYDRSQASTRVRFLQYLSYLTSEGYEVEIFPILRSEGIYGRSGKVIFFISRVLSWFRVIIKLVREKSNHPYLHIHSELFPFVPYWFESGFLRSLGIKNYIIELDDAWFHRYDDNKYMLVRFMLGGKIYKLMKHSSLVIAGNKYIADNAKNAGARNVEIIPTVVDIERYTDYLTGKVISNDRRKLSSESGEELKIKSRPIIGWIGSPATSRYLVSIENVIRNLTNSGIADFIAVGADPAELKGLPVEVIMWSENSELEFLSKIDLGIMPLQDTPFERGKCGYKLLQYMACSLPVVASPVGVNKDIVIHNETGFLVTTENDWIDTLTSLCCNKELRDRLGKNGFARVSEYYSLNKTAPRLVSVINQVLNQR